MASRQTNGSKRNKMEAEAEAESKKQRSRMRSTAMRPAQKPVGGKFSASLLLCLSDLMGRRKEEEYNTKMVDGYEARSKRRLGGQWRPVAAAGGRVLCTWARGQMAVGRPGTGHGGSRGLDLTQGGGLSFRLQGTKG